LKILLNNREEVIERGGISVSELLVLKNFTFKLLIVKINGQLVKKDEYDLTMIHDGDDVTVLHLISGG
jgi:thiamine biosynthesis protein ThiS